MIRTCVLIALAGLLVGCTASESRTPARIVMKGARDRVAPLAGEIGRSLTARVSLTGPDDATEATLVVPARTPDDRMATVMNRCIKAGVSCTIQSETVRRDYHLG